MIMAEGTTAQTVRVRSGRAPRCRRTQARMYVQRRDLGGLPVTTVHSTVVAKVKAVAKRRMNGGEESDSGIVPLKRANKAGGIPVAESVEGRPGRNGRREGKAMLRTQSREAPSWVRCWTGTEWHGGSREVPSRPERGAGCLSGHVRICGGGRRVTGGLPRPMNVVTAQLVSAGLTGEIA